MHSGCSWRSRALLESSCVYISLLQAESLLSVQQMAGPPVVRCKALLGRDQCLGQKMTAAAGTSQV